MLIFVNFGVIKIFITFMIGKQSFKADWNLCGLKLQKLAIIVCFICFSIEKANALAAAMEEEKKSVDMQKFVPRLPEIDDTHFPLKISQV